MRKKCAICGEADHRTHRVFDFEQLLKNLEVDTQRVGKYASPDCLIRERQKREKQRKRRGQ